MEGNLHRPLGGEQTFQLWFSVGLFPQHCWVPGERTPLHRQQPLIPEERLLVSLLTHGCHLVAVRAGAPCGARPVHCRMHVVVPASASTSHLRPQSLPSVPRCKHCTNCGVGAKQHLCDITGV